MKPLADKRILLVEDEVLIAEMVVDMLVGLGATVVGPATTLEKGLALARSRSGAGRRRTGRSRLPRGGRRRGSG